MTDFPGGERPDGPPINDGFPEYDNRTWDGPGSGEAGDGVVADEAADNEPADIDDNLPNQEGAHEPRAYARERLEGPTLDPGFVAALAVDRTVRMVDLVDPELIDNSDTRQLVELGARAGYEITGKYGTPDRPKVVSGTYERGVFMVYHNGGEDGHTSVGEQGAGVPRNVLTIAGAVNEAAGREIYTADDRATAFYAAEEHDRVQLCGRSLMPEGAQGSERGDERLSAEGARNRLLAAGASPEKADRAYDLVVSTAWNPDTSTQNVRRETLDSADPGEFKVLLGRELIACSDLFSPSSGRGVLGTVEYAAERLCLVQNGQVMQQRLDALGIDPSTITNTQTLMDVIGSDRDLTQAFTDILADDPVFYADYLRYEDTAIKQVTGGRGINELFPGIRLANASTLALDVMRLREGVPPAAIWRLARHNAGY